MIDELEELTPHGPFLLRKGIKGKKVGAKRQTHCKHGHEMTPDNVFISRSKKRACLTCKRAGDKQRSAARRAALKAKE